MKLRMRSSIGLMLSLMTLVMFGCGDDGGGSPTTVKGVAAAGPIVGGTVTLFRINPDTTTTQLTTTPATVTTKSPFGNFSAAVSYSGPLLVQVNGGSYTDEASGLTLTNTGGLMAVVPNVTGTVANISVTPHTTVAAQLAETAPGATIADKINAANTATAKALRLPDGFDIITTPVTDANYAFALAAFSQGALTSSGNSTDPAALAAASAANVAGLPAQIDIATGSVTDPATNQAITQAIQDATNNPNIVVPPSIDLTAPAGVTLSASPATGVINNSVTITATVAAVGNASTVPNTTTVTFTTSAGTITPSATTTNGVATATLSGISAAQAVTVKASVGSIASAPLTVNFINDPNAPGGISVTANPTSLFAGQGSSTISATVTPAGQGGVIADGTVVTFATTVGTITASATTTNGVATATLTSAVTGTASVTATVNGITSAPVSVVINALPVQAIVKLAINGTLPAGTTIDGAQFILNYVTNKGLSIVDAGIVASGGATASLIINNLTVAGVINSAFANANASPIAPQAGEFATLTFTITGATAPFPALGDFTISSSTVATTPVLATPLTVSVLSVTLQ